MRFMCKKIRPKTINWAGKSGFWVVGRNITCTSYLFIYIEVIAGKDIDRFSMPRRMSTPRINVIRCTEFLEFCIDRSIGISPYVSGFTRHGVSRRSHFGFHTMCTRAAGLGIMAANLEISYVRKCWSKEYLSYGPARSCVAFTFFVWLSGWTSTYLQWNASVWAVCHGSDCIVRPNHFTLTEILDACCDRGSN